MQDNLQDNLIEPYVNLSGLTSMKVGGKALYFSEVDNVKDLISLINWSKQERLPYFVLGGGTNVIFSDKGYEGLVIKVKGQKFCLYPDGKLIAEAGATMADLVYFAVENGLSGLEWAGGLPGTLGGAIRGNAGAFGGEMKNLVGKIAVIAPDNNKVEILENDESKFSYRNSLYKEEGGIILAAELFLKPADNVEELKKSMEEKIEYRKAFHPLEYPNSGSFFKNITNPEAIERVLYKLPYLRKEVEETWGGKIPVAVLISELGLSGKEIGGAEISRKHANFIVNAKGASAEDIIITSSVIKNKMQSSFGILLEEEVEYSGF